MSASYLVRFDDICPTMRWDTWFRIEARLIHYGVKPILAVVPDNCDPELMVDPPRPDFWDHVRRWRDLGWTIALHGYQHRYVTTDSGLMRINRTSEFAGLPPAVQQEKIRAGLEIFAGHGVRPDVWVAPAHAFDTATLAALREHGIAIVSDGFSPRPFATADGMRWIPQQIWRYMPFPAGTWTICYHHNSWGESQLTEFERTLRRIGTRHTSVRELVAGDVASRSIGDRAFGQFWWAALRSKTSLARAVGRVRSTVRRAPRSTGNRTTYAN
jgi:predicted deacetylase